MRPSWRPRHACHPCSPSPLTQARAALDLGSWACSAAHSSAGSPPCSRRLQTPLWLRVGEWGGALQLLRLPQPCPQQDVPDGDAVVLQCRGGGRTLRLPHLRLPLPAPGHAGAGGPGGDSRAGPGARYVQVGNIGGQRRYRTNRAMNRQHIYEVTGDVASF